MPNHIMIDVPEVEFMEVTENVAEWRLGERAVIKTPKFLCGWGLGIVIVIPLMLWVAYTAITSSMDDIMTAVLWCGGTIAAMGFYYYSPVNRGNRGREVTIDWNARTITVRAGVRTDVKSLDDVRRLCLQTTATHGTPTEYRGVLEVDVAGKQIQLFETLMSHKEKNEPTNILLAVTRRLAESMSVPFEVYLEGRQLEPKELDGLGRTESELAQKYEQLGSIASGYAMSADFHGNAAEAEEHRQEAVFYLMQAHNLDPSLPEPLLKIGRLSKNEEHRDAAIDAALQQNPDNVPALIERAHQLNLDGLEDEAIEALTEAVEKEPSVRTYQARAEACQSMGRYELAHADFSEAIKLDPEDADCYSSRAECLKEWYENSSKSDLIDQALADFDQAIRLDPEDSSFVTERGTMYRAAGRLQEAIDDFSTAIERDAESIYALSQRGQAYLECGDAAREAERDFSRMIDVLEEQPRTTDETMSYFQTTSIAAAYRWRAEARRQLGQMEQADADHELAVSMSAEME